MVFNIYYRNKVLEVLKKNPDFFFKLTCLKFYICMLCSCLLL